MFGVRSLLTAEKALLIRNDLAGMLLRRPMPIIAAVDAFVRSDRHMSISDIVRHTDISRDSVHRIVRNHLKFRKVSAWWVPKQLKPEQQAIRMMTSLDNLQCYKIEGKAMLERIVTGDETWVHHYQPETKQASRQWKHKESRVSYAHNTSRAFRPNYQVTLKSRLRVTQGHWKRNH